MADRIVTVEEAKAKLDALEGKQRDRAYYFLYRLNAHWLAVFIGLEEAEVLVEHYKQVVFGQAVETWEDAIPDGLSALEGQARMEEAALGPTTSESGDSPSQTTVTPNISPKSEE